MKKIKILLLVVILNITSVNITNAINLLWGTYANDISNTSPTLPMCYGPKTLLFAVQGEYDCNHNNFKLEYSTDNSTWHDLYNFPETDCFNTTRREVNINFTQKIYIRAVEHDWGTFCSKDYYSNTLVFNVYNSVDGGTISSDQTICYGTSPSIITGSTPASNNAPYTFQWQISTDNITYTNIPNYSKDLTYAEVITTKTYFKRITTFSSCGSATSNAVTINVYPQINPGTISNPLAGSKLCYNISPGTITGTSATGGIGNYTYKWYSMSLVGFSKFSEIPGANSENYTVPNLTSSRAYKRVVINTCTTGSTSNVINFYVSNDVTPGTISSFQEICYNSVPDLLIGTAATGGDGVFAYQWQQSTDNGTNWNNIALNATNKDYQPLALTTTTMFRRQDSEDGCLTNYKYTNNIKITVLPIYVIGTISSDQTICYGTQPLPLIGTIPTGGSGVYTYQWQMSTDNVNWSNLSATSQNYQPSILTRSTWFRRMESNTCGNYNTNTVKITVSAELIPGSILPLTQTICYGTQPAQLISSSATGGTGSYNYQWQQSADNFNWTDIGSATGQNYQPPVSTTSKWYRVKITSTGCNEIFSYSVNVDVYPQIIPGTIYTDQTICYDTQPSLLYGDSPSGGDGVYAYQWQKSNDGNSWTDLIGATNATYQPVVLTSTTYYRRGVNTTSCLTWLYSNTITITVYSDIISGTISSDQTICYGTSPNLLTGTPATGGTSNKTYQWYKSTNGGSIWNAIMFATELNYQPDTLIQTTKYMREDITSPCGSKTTIIVTITVQPQIIPGTIASDQVISYNTIPEQINGTVASGGSGTYTYQWQYSLNDTLFFNILGATNVNYQPPALAETTYYRRLVISGGCGPIASNRITITVFDQLFAGKVGYSQIVCYNTAPATLVEVSSPAGGSGTYLYQWQNSTDKIAWTDILSANATSTTPPALSTTTYYRRRVIATLSIDTAYSNIININVNPDLNPGTLYSSHTICHNATPDLIIGTPATGGFGNYTYQWQFSNDGISFFPLPGGASDLNYQSSSLTQTVYYKRITTSETCGSKSSDVITITVLPPLYEGEISDDQTICYNSTPDLLIGTSAMGGDGVYAYQWQNSIDSITFYNIIGATNISYQPPVLLKTQWYKRTAVSVPAGCLRQQTNTVKIKVLPKMTPGIISKDTTICNYVSPGLLTGTPATGGYGGNFSYQWQKSTDNGNNWNNISGATTISFTAPVLTTTTWFRRMAISHECQSDFSNHIIVTVFQPIAAATIKTDHPTICYNTIPTLIYTDIATTGGDGNYTYQWQQSTNNVTWTDITGETSDAYQPTLPATQTKYYRIKINNSCKNVYSNTVTLNVQGVMYVGLIGNNQTIGYNQVPKLITGEASTSDVTFTYQWQVSDDSLNWVNIINNSTSQNYQPLALTKKQYFRRLTINDCAEGKTNVIKINVNTEICSNNLPADTTICYGIQPDTIFATIPTGGSGAYTYQWQISYDASAFTNILNATKYYYRPGAITKTTYFKRVVYDGYDTSYSNIMTYNLYDVLKSGKIGDSQTICNGTQPSPLYTSIYPTGGHGAYAYQWQQSTNNVTWTDITGETNDYYFAPSLTQNTWYRKKVINTCETKYSDTVKITVKTPLIAGQIGISQTISYNSVPNQIMGETPSGGYGNYTYQWQYSLDSIAFNNVITNSTGQNYQPDSLKITTYFRRMTYDNCANSISNIIKIAVVPVIVPGVISENQIICYGTQPPLITGTSATGGIGTYNYQWQKSSNGISWIDLIGEISQNYQPPVSTTTTYYQRKDYAQYCTATYTNYVIISVRAEVTKPIIPVNSTYCKGTNVVVNIQNASASYIYNWHDNQGTYLHSGTTHSVNNIQETNKLFVQAVDTINNCKSFFDTLYIRRDSIKAHFIVSSSKIDVGDFVQFKSEDYSVSAVSWEWNFYDGDGSNLENPYHYYNTKGTKNVFLKVSSINNCVDSILIQNAISVGPLNINELTDLNSINIYPTPAIDILYLDYLNENEKYEIYLMDLTGKILFNESIRGKENHHINISNYADGIYMIKIINNNNVKINKVIKQS